MAIRYLRQIRQGRGAHTARVGGAALLNLVVQESLPEQATYE